MALRVNSRNEASQAQDYSNELYTSQGFVPNRCVEADAVNRAAHAEH